MDKSFFDLQLSPWIVRQLATVGINSPTPVQVNCIPQILAGRDVIGVAKTGSGKTLAFALPILHLLAEDPYGIFAVIVTPTRELAFQIKESFAVIGRCMNLRQSVVVGGLEMISQGQELSKKPHIVVGTPGRLNDHLNSCDTFHFRKIKFLVLDEADKLLGGYFDSDMKGIFRSVPENRQTLLFSATMTDTLDKVKQVAKNDMFLWQQSAEVKTVEQLLQYYVFCPSYAKDGYLVESLRKFTTKDDSGSVIIFTDTCKNCQLLSMVLNLTGFKNVALHNMMRQSERLNSLHRFKSNHVTLLVATDLASRGLDIPLVELVINYAVPVTVKDYIHRVGRTARAGKPGYAITLVTPNEIELLKDIEKEVNTTLAEFKINNKEVAKIFTQITVTKGECEIKLEECKFYEKREINKRKKLLLEGKDPDLQDRILNKLKE
uniref:RNA helicase n=4 Tax=Rhodnius TaxID=13248 RepID=T1HTS0_RHOPR